VCGNRLPFCPNCGKQIEATNVSFCPYCGNALNFGVTKDRWSSVEKLTGPFRIVGGLLILAVGVILYVYSSNYAATIQSCLNGLLCSLGSFLTGNTSHLQEALSQFLLLEASGIIVSIIGAAIMAFGLYNTVKAGRGESRS
jgi:hypothetical protein